MNKAESRVMNVLVTGGNGFIGKNLILRLNELATVKIYSYTRSHNLDDLKKYMNEVDVVFHLAGINRPTDEQEFQVGNVDLTQSLCELVEDVVITRGRKIPIIFASTDYGDKSHPYAKTKLAAEKIILRLWEKYSVPVYIYRLTNVFGKWCKPDYNSVVATFCHNIARGLPIHIHDSDKVLALVYIDDVVDSFQNLLNHQRWENCDGAIQFVNPLYKITLGDLACLLKKFSASRNTLLTERVGEGLTRALYSTYVSYLPLDSFSYNLTMYEDERGKFAEMLKTPDCGQFSYFTAGPGVTRGEHYHHTKTEKFLVIQGKARFRFRHVLTNEVHEIYTNGDVPQVVETIPGWAHDITNVGDVEMLVMLWANENFDRSNPDTIACKV